METVQRSAENKGKRKEEGVLERMKGKAEVRVWTLNLKALTKEESCWYDGEKQ